MPMLARKCFPAVFVGAVAALLSTQALADASNSDQASYLDNRSTPASLVRSLYNAISLKQYARAWSYFGDAKPTADYESFAAGYQGTEHVTVTVGDVATEGAAGSIYGMVPVAIEAEGANGRQVFGGCYLTRMLQPQIAAPDFRPRFIVKGHLEKRRGTRAEAMPKSCDSNANPSFE